MTDSELAALLLLLIMSLLVVVSGTLLFVLLSRQRRSRLAVSTPLAAGAGVRPGPQSGARRYRSVTPLRLASPPRVPSFVAPIRVGRWPAAHLVVDQGPLRGNRIPVGRPMLALGRGSGCDISLPDPRASRQHARLEWRKDGFYLVDTNSTNGTFVNRSRVSERRLRGGEQVRIGNTVFTIQLY